MIRLLVSLYISCLIMFLVTVKAEDTVSPFTLSAVQSIKDVKNICLGYIDGPQADVNHFKQELQKQLVQEGFTVTKGSDSCDATLIGSLQVNIEHYDPIRALINHSWVNHLTSAYIKLINANWKQIWEKTYKPHEVRYNQLIPSQRVYSLSDGELNRAIDIARSLAKARKKDK